MYLTMNESCLTCEWVMSQMNQSCNASHYESVMSHMWMSRVMYATVALWTSHVTRANESCRKWIMSHMWISHVTNKWVMRCVLLCMSHITHLTHASVMYRAMNESCHTCEWGMSHMNEACHTYEWVTSHISRMHRSSIALWMSHVTRVNESCRKWIMSHMWISPVTNDWVMRFILLWMSHITHMNESHHTYEWVTSHVQHIHQSYIALWLSHVTHVNESCHTCE